MKREQHSTYSVVRTVVSGAMTDEPVFARIAAEPVPAPNWARPPQVSETRDDFLDQIRNNVEAARQAERDPWSSRNQPIIGDRGRHAGALARDVQRVFRQAVAASDGALRYTTSLRLEGTAHTLEWVEPAPRRSLTVIVNERAIIWSWLAPDRKSLENRIDPLHADLETIQAFVLDLTDYAMWSGKALPSFVQ